MAQAFRTQNLRLLASILDANDNELIKSPSPVASAVNELTITNAATSVSPSISATGDDTNIGLNLISKGTGLIQINGKAISLANSFTTIGNFSLAFTTTASTSLTLPTSGLLATTDQIPTVNNATLTLAGSGGIGIDSPPTFTANASADKTITISIADAALTIAKLENIATSSILGRTTGSSGPVEILGGSGVVSVIGTNAVSRATNLEGGIAGQIPYQSGANTTLFSAAGSLSQVLLSGAAGAPTWASQSTLSVGSATTAGSVTNALTISSPLTGTSYNGSTAISIGLQNASDTLAGGVSIGPQTFAGNKTFKDSVIVSGDLTVNGTTITINSSTLSVDDKNIELGAVIAIASLSSTSNITATSNIVDVTSTSGLIVGQALTKTTGTGAFGTNPIIDSIVSATQFTVTPVHAITGSIVFSVSGATDITADTGGITLKGATNKTFNWLNATSSWTSSENLDIVTGKTYKINNVAVLSATTLGSSVVNSSLTSVGTLANLTVTNTITGSVSGSAASLSTSHTFWGQTFNGTQDVSGNLTSVGNITGTSGITITAGGSNQNVVLTPTGTGYTLLNGNVGIGTASPEAILQVANTGRILGVLRLQITPRTTFYDHTFAVDNDGGGAQGFIYTSGTGGTFPLNTYGELILQAGPRTDFNNGISLVTGTTSPSVKLRIEEGGNVGIGTTSPNGRLDVRTTGQAGVPALGTAGNGINLTRFDGQTGGSIGYTTEGHVYIQSQRFDSANSNNLFLQPVGGNVGIGTTTPAQKLELYGVVDDPYASGVNSIAMMRFSNTTDNAILDIGMRAAGAGAWLQSTDKTNLGVNYPLLLNPNGGNVSVGSLTSNNKLHVNGSASIGSGYNTAATTNGLIVEGNVGIGVTGPTAKLDVAGSATSGYSLLLRSGDAYNQTDSVQIAFGHANTTNYRHSIRTRHNPLAPISGIVGNNIDFYVWKRGTDAAADLGTQFVMTMQGDGAVGIGVTNPVSANKLSVSGSVSVGSNYNIAAPTNGLIVEGDMGIGITSPLAKLHVNSTTSGATLLRTDGTNGTLFSVVDDLSDSLMSVNNSAGLPVLEVFADDRIVAGQYGQNDFVVINNKVGLGANSPINKLSVIGSASIGDSTYNVSAPTNGLIVQGNVGIGTNNPSQLLEIKKTTGSAIALLNYNDVVKFNINASSGGAGYVGMVTNHPLIFVINDTEKWKITSAGVLESNGAQTIRTSIDSLTLATNGANGNIILSPHGNGNVGIGDTTTTAKLDVNGTVRIRSISASGSAGTIFLTTNATGILVSRTAAEVRSDILAAAIDQTFFIGTTSIAINRASGASFALTGISSIDGTAAALASMDITQFTGTLAVANGGTGVATAAINTIFAGPSSGSAAAPSFRAMVSADIPTGIVSYAKIQNVNPNTVLGRIANSAGIVEELSGANIATIIGSSAITNASNVTIATDDSTASSYYLYFGANITGNTPLKASTKIRYNPSTGAFSATTKSFRIPHPTKLEHDLVYGSLESPYHGVRLTGKGKTKGNRAEIFLPDYVKSLIDEETVNIQLTVIKCAKILYIENIIIDDNKFTVKYDKPWYEKCKDIEFYWDFTAERKDVPKLIVEEKI